VCPSLLLTYACSTINHAVITGQALTGNFSQGKDTNEKQVNI
jgi:hypothetical protein